MSGMDRSCFEPGGFVYEFNGGCDPLPPNVSRRIVETNPPRLFSSRDEDLAAAGWRRETITPSFKHPDPFLNRTFTRYVRDVTWDEVMAERRARQRERLADINRDVTEKRAVQVNVKHYGNGLLGGWQAYLIAPGNDDRAISNWRRYDCSDLMKRFPLNQHGAPLFPCTDKHDWMVAFAHTYRRGTFHGKPWGATTCWALCQGTSVRELLP
jgi:hypothetical protein